MEEEEHVWGWELLSPDVDMLSLRHLWDVPKGLLGAVFVHVSKYGHFSTLRENISEADVLKVPPTF